MLGDIKSGFDAAAQADILCCSEADKPECGGCALKPRCISWCACINWQTTGHVNRASPIVCEHDRMLMPIVDRVANRLWKRRSPLFIHKHYNPAFPALAFAEEVVLKEVSRVKATTS